MLAAYAGYGLDGFDFMIYTFVIPTLIALWGMNKAEAGYIASAALITSAIGGWAAGILADRFGRVACSAADGGVVRGVYLLERLHAFLRSTVRHPRPARIRIWR